MWKNDFKRLVFIIVYKNTEWKHLDKILSKNEKKIWRLSIFHPQSKEYYTNKI